MHDSCYWHFKQKNPITTLVVLAIAVCLVLSFVSQNSFSPVVTKALEHDSCKGVINFPRSTGQIFYGGPNSAAGRLCYVTTVFNEYEAMRPPPINLPSDWVTFYITDNATTAANAIQFGWNSSVSLDQSYYRSPNFRFRLAMIANARIWPERLTDLSMCDHLAFGDGNVAGIDSIYLDWVKASAASGAALSLLNGWYLGARDCALVAELSASTGQRRWGPDAEAMRSRVPYYEAALRAQLKNFSLPKIEVISAKYIVWNLRHPQRHLVAEWIATEYAVHLQGNIILSVAAYLFPNLILVSSYREDYPFQPNLATHARTP